MVSLEGVIQGSKESSESLTNAMSYQGADEEEEEYGPVSYSGAALSLPGPSRSFGKK
mgnify:FL=1